MKGQEEEAYWKINLKGEKAVLCSWSQDIMLNEGSCEGQKWRRMFASGQCACDGACNEKTLCSWLNWLGSLPAPKHLSMHSLNACLCISFVPE